MRLRIDGFTLVEMISVLMVVGVLAVVALPRLSNIGAFTDVEYRDEIAAALRYAQKMAVAQRRLVCVTAAGNQINLAIASANPAVACTFPMPGPIGRDPAVVPPASGVVLAVTTSPFYFQPSGVATSDSLGATIVDVTLTPTSQPAITVYGATGRVE